MVNLEDIMETVNMIQEENLDIRTITMGISLIDCADSDINASCSKVYDKIYYRAKDLVKTGEAIERKYGIPIVNKRIAVTPVSLLAGVSGGDPFHRRDPGRCPPRGRFLRVDAEPHRSPCPPQPRA